MNRKSILAILTCLMLIGSFAAGLLPAIVQAEPELITLWGIRTSDPYWGYFGGYHDIWAAIKPELEKIGFEIKIDTFDAFTFEGYFYDDWNITGDPDDDGTRDGWDLATREWWLNPTSHIWLDEMVQSYQTPVWNVMPWMDEQADYLYIQAMAQVGDSARYKQYMRLWQEEFMHNPPVIPNYYGEIMTARAAFLDGYDDTSWVYGLRELRVDQDTWNALDAAGKLPAARKAIGSDTLIWAGVEPIDQWNPMYTVYYTEEAMNVLRLGMLYRNERENNDFPPSGVYRVHPDIAADDVTWLDAATVKTLYGYDPPISVARMPIRSGIYWSDGVLFNATDVAFTLNSVIDKKAGSFARGDYVNVIKEAVVNDTLTCDIICYAPRYDLAGYFAHGWGIAMLPYHQLAKWEIENKLTAWKTHASNYDPIPESLGGDGLEVVGPYVPVSSDYPATTYIQFERFDVATGQPWYWTGLTLADGPNAGEQWGWALPENFIVKVIPDAADRLIALQTLECDFAEYPTAPVETYEAMKTTEPYKTTHKVYTYQYCASNPLWFNLNNPILSNRYVRLAIAHAIPYPKIYNEILPGWGVAKVVPGRSFYLPWMEAFNAELEPYEYNIDKAKMYMDMYRKSQAGSENYPVDDDPLKAQGPVGDADLSGLVDLDDLFVWRDRYLAGTAPSTYTQFDYPYDYEFPEIQSADMLAGKYWPGNNVDPDFDNDDSITFATSGNPWGWGDWEFWSRNRATSYPFKGAR